MNLVLKSDGVGKERTKFRQKFWILEYFTHFKYNKYIEIGKTIENVIVKFYMLS